MEEKETEEVEETENAEVETGEESVEEENTESTEEENEEIEEEPEHEEAVPYDRFSEVNESNKVLQKAVDLLSSRLAPKQEDEPEPDVDEDTKKAIEFYRNKDRKQYETVIGRMFEETDELKAAIRIPGYSDPKSKIAEKIEAIRRQAASQNQFMNREQAYTYLVGSGAIKPAKKQPVIEKKKPKVVTESKSMASAAAKGSASKNSTSVEKRLEGKSF